MKKILYVATVDIHIKTFHLPYLKMLHDMGYEVHVATNGKEEFPNCDKKHTICIERSPYKLNNIKAIKQLKKIIDKEKFDIIHCHTPMGAVVARLAAKNARKKYGTRVIYTAHGFHFFKGAPLLNWLLFYPIEWYLSKYTDKLITINHEDEILALRKFSKRCENIVRIPGIGVDNSKFDEKMTNAKENKLRKEFNLDVNDFVIIYPARLCKDKNQKLLLDFMKINKNVNIKLLLAGKDEYNGYYQKYVAENKIDNVQFLGHRTDVIDLLRISDLLVATSIREGFGINLVEALACKIPVIAVDNRGHREIVKNGINGYIISNKVDELFKIINILCDKNNEYIKLIDNCYNTASEFFLDKSLDAMEIIYDQI